MDIKRKVKYMTETTRFNIDYGNFLSQHDVIYDKPVEPYEQKKGENFIDGPLMGNGDIGIVAHGTPGKTIFSVGKNDIWDRRSMSVNGSIDSGKCYPCPKPAGQIIFADKALIGANFHQRLSLYNALLESRFETETTKVSLSAYVSALENVILGRYDYRGDRELDLTLDMYRWSDRYDDSMTEPVFGNDRKYFWIRHMLPADELFPEGFEYVLVGTIKGAEYETEAFSNTVRARISGKKKSRIDIYIAVVTSRDASDPLTEAKAIVDRTVSAGYDAVLSKHHDWWHSFWEKSFIILSDDLMENMWYLNQYFLACCSRQGKVAPGLYGNWITNDYSCWHGDYHLDYNFQQQYYGVYSSNHIELAWPYYETIIDNLPAAKQEAKQTYGCRGAKYPVCTYPIKMKPELFDRVVWDKIMCISAWVTQCFWWHYLYTLDETFLKEKAYPLMVECARFYQEYMKKENGKYGICPTVSPEHWAEHFATKDISKVKYTKNCTIDLALIKFLLKASIKAGEILDVDKEDRMTWQNILDNMVGYPTHKTPMGRTIFVDMEGAPPIRYNFPVPVSPIFPGEDIGIDSPRETWQIANDTVDLIQVNGNDAFISWSIAGIRLGCKEMYQKIRNLVLQRIKQNGTLSMFPGWRNAGPVVENFAITAVINEMMLQSYNGKIRVFPALPEDMEAKISDLRAVGAFLVSSEVSAGEVKYVTIRSLKGAKCTIVNPWKQERPRIKDITHKKELKDVLSEDNTLTFDTRQGHVYLIDRDSKPFELWPRTVLKVRKRRTPKCLLSIGRM